MLGKLMRLELKATGRMFIPFYLSLLFFAVVNGFLLPANETPLMESPLYQFAMVSSLIIYGLLMLGLVVSTLYVMVQRFYKNLLGDEGYLMFTLPVKAWEHIASKLIVSIIWILVSGLVGILSIIVIFSRNILTLEFYKEFMMVMAQIAEILRHFGPLTTIGVLIVVPISLAAIIMPIYSAISLGHLFHKHKLLYSFGIYILLNTISEAINTLFLFNVNYTNSLIQWVLSSPTTVQLNIGLYSVILYSSISTAIYFFITNYVLTRKLNLE